MAGIFGTVTLTLCLVLAAGDAAAWKNVPLKERRIEKIPYRPQWVSAVKKEKIFKYKRKEFSSPRIQGESVFVGSGSGYFYAMKKKNGANIWRFKADAPINSAPAFWNEFVLFGDDEGQLHALTVADGKEAWKTNLGSEILSEPAVGANRVFVATVEGKVAALAADSGKILWEVARKPEFTGHLSMTIRGNASPALDEPQDRLYVGFSDGVVQCLSASTGKTVWEKSLVQESKESAEMVFEDVDGTPVLDDDRVYAATFDGGLFALSKKNGSVLWSQPAGSGVRALVMDGLLIVSGSRGRLQAYDRRDGNRLWESPVGEGALTAPVAYHGLIAVGLSNDTMNFLSSEDGHVIARRFARKGVSSDPVVEGDRIYYLSNGGRLYSLRLIP